MLNILPIIPSSTFQKFTHYNYSHIILYALLSGIDIHAENVDLIHILLSYCVNVNDVYTYK